MEDVMKELLNTMAQSVIDGDTETACRLAKEALEKNLDPVVAIESGYAKGMETVGGRFEKGDCFLPEVLLAEEAMTAAVEILKPKIEARAEKKAFNGKILIGTIQGDVHDIGKNIVKLILGVGGFEIIDLGREVPVKTFIEAAKRERPDIIAISALMTTTMIYMPELIKQLNELGIRSQFKVMVGGAPVIPKWAQQIGADGYGKDTKEAMEVALKLVQKS
jgi:trimethylamine corrinoid protein